jgi:HK97 family phage prohead protease
MSENIIRRLKGLNTKKAGIYNDPKLGEVPIYTAMASPAVVDRDDELILPSAFKNLREYISKNPVMYYDHAWATWGTPREETLPVGKAIKAKAISEKGLEISWIFHDLPFAQKIQYLVDAGVLNMISIGFIGKAYERDPDVILDLMGKEGIKADSPPRLLFTWVELLENSIVGVPANQDAAIQRDSISEKELVKVKTLLRELEDECGGSCKNLTGAQGDGQGVEEGRKKKDPQLIFAQSIRKLGAKL